MSFFACPVCGEPLTEEEKRCVCPKGHSFDRAKAGYVNLALNQQSADKRHGDDKAMVEARTAFLEKGYYAPVRDAVCRAVAAKAPAPETVMDVGCGEGYYTAAIAGVCPQGAVLGVDLSREALKAAHRRKSTAQFAVASAFRLPLPSKSADVLVSAFAPSAYAEFYRVLKPEGVLVKAVPLSEHLWELKTALYEKPYHNKPELLDETRFVQISAEELRYPVLLKSAQEIDALFKMTPYYYKTSRADAQKLAGLTELQVTVHIAVERYRKRDELCLKTTGNP